MLGYIKTLWTKFAKAKYRYPAVALAVVTVCVMVFSFTAVPSVLAQSAELRLPELTAATAGQRVLVFSPHPDDETIAAGGYIIQSLKNGADVRIVLVTDGNSDHQEAIRYAEFRAATAILGVPSTNLVFLGFPDGKLNLVNPARLRAALQHQIQLYQPDIVIYPNPYDYNPDHATIGRLLEPVLPKLNKYEYLIHYELIYPQPYAWKFEPHLYLLPPTRLTKVEKEWLKLPLSQEVENRKEKALLSYHSQMHSPELIGLLHSFIRMNELFAVPKS